MIDEIRIMSKTGANIFSGKIDLEKSEVQPSDTDVLFAGFISAILSVSEELQDSDIRELGYQDQKIIFTLTKNLIFLGFVDTRVPNDEIQNLLDDVIKRWMKEYDDGEYPFVSGEMRTNIQKMVEDSIREVFWWTTPDYTLSNNLKLIKTTFQKPSGSYFIQYLPKIYLLSGFLLLLVSITIGASMNIAFTGFASGEPIQGTRVDTILATLSTVLLFTVGTSIALKIMYRDNFHMSSFIIIGGIYSLLFIFLFFFTSSFYFSYIYEPIASAVGSDNSLKYAVDIIFYLATFNIAFFGFVVIQGYTTSFNNSIPTNQYMVAYLFSILIMISLAEFISGALLGVIPQ